MPNVKVLFTGDRLFWWALPLLLALAVGHSLWATSLDGFTIDEPYHIAAGASYVRWGDYRLNPEHPPLVKLVAGLSVPPSVLHLEPLRLLQEKGQEREYTQKAVFLESDSAQVQRRARAAAVGPEHAVAGGPGVGTVARLRLRHCGRRVAIAGARPHRLRALARSDDRPAHGFAGNHQP